MHSANDLSATKISIWQKTKISYLTYSPAVRKSAKENPTSVYRFDIEMIGLDIIKENTERNTNLFTSFLFNIVMYRKHNKPSGVSDWKFRCTEYGRQTQTVDEKIFSEFFFWFLKLKFCWVLTVGEKFANYLEPIIMLKTFWKSCCADKWRKVIRIFIFI